LPPDYSFHTDFAALKKIMASLILYFAGHLNNRCPFSRNLLQRNKLAVLGLFLDIKLWFAYYANFASSATKNKKSYNSFDFIS
jgi:hypothetical protein